MHGIVIGEEEDRVFLQIVIKVDGGDVLREVAGTTQLVSDGRAGNIYHRVGNL